MSCQLIVGYLGSALQRCSVSGGVGVEPKPLHEKNNITHVNWQPEVNILLMRYLFYILVLVRCVITFYCNKIDFQSYWR